MNFESFPSGAWSWLAAMGYSRADVEAIVARRQHRPSESAGPRQDYFGTEAMAYWEPGGKVSDFMAGILHANAPAGCKCSDCTIDEEACPTCYAAWWVKRHPNKVLVDPNDPSTIRVCIEAINQSIAKGPLQGNGCDETAQRNGLILASNLLASMLPDDEDRILEDFTVFGTASEVPEWMAKAQQEFRDTFAELTAALAAAPLFLDAEPMTRVEIMHRRLQGHLQHCRELMGKRRTVKLCDESRIIREQLSWYRSLRNVVEWLGLPKRRTEK